MVGRREQWMRFIPARAGNTAVEVDFHAAPPVYPRSCGEHTVDSGGAHSHSGLSPLVRGTHCRFRQYNECGRFIPARAGNTNTGDPRFIVEPVYPRSCGEHGKRSGPPVCSPGLSPLVRGTQVSPRRAISAHRFIPARAGNTSGQPRNIPDGVVYPRSCGEHYLSPDLQKIAGGLSPLVRGTPVNEASKDATARFIPARAGNTLKLYNCIYYAFSGNNIPPTFGSQSHIVKERLTY